MPNLFEALKQDLPHILQSEPLCGKTSPLKDPSFGTTNGAEHDKCERGDSNPQAHRTLDPKSSASANSATLA